MWLFGFIFIHSVLHGVHGEKSPHWVDICGGSYLFSEDTKSWSDAVDQCELYFSHLVQIDSMAENFCLLDYAHAQDVPSVLGYWHSGNDIESEGVYRQGDGELLAWQPLWYNGVEPSGGTAQNCLGVHLATDANSGKWWDDPCNNVFNYICER